MRSRMLAVIWTILFLCQGVSVEIHVQPVIEPGPSSGIMIEESPGFLITNRKVFSQKIFISLDPKVTIEKYFDVSKVESPEIKSWYQEHVKRIQSTTKEMLGQLQKSFPGGSYNVQSRTKRSPGVIAGLVATSVIGFSAVTAAAVSNSISISNLNHEMSIFREQMATMMEVLKKQKESLSDMMEIVNDTVVTTNLHSGLSIRAIKVQYKHELIQNELLSFLDPVVYFTGNWLREIQSGIESLVEGRIPLYFVNKDIIKTMLLRAYGKDVDEMQINIAFDAGSALPLYIDPQNMELCFLIKVPHMSFNDIYQLKVVHNVDTWKNNIHVQIQTPSVVAYQSRTSSPYLVPKLETCVKFKDHNYLCPGKPFLNDASKALCGVRFMSQVQEQCEVTMTKTDDLAQTRAVLVKDKWLVSTNLKNMTVTYIMHGGVYTIPIPYNVMLIQVPKDHLVTIGDITLFYIESSVLDGEVEVVDAFQGREIPIDAELMYLLNNKPNHTVKMNIRKDDLSISDFMYPTFTGWMSPFNIWNQKIGAIISIFDIFIVIWNCGLTILWYKNFKRGRYPPPLSLRMVDHNNRPYKTVI